MKKTFIFALILFFTSNIFAQVGINSDGSTPNGSAMLHIKANDAGLLIPKVQLSGNIDITTIASPANSLLVYNNGVSWGNEGYYYNAGNTITPNWIQLSTSGIDGDGATNHVAIWSDATTLGYDNNQFYWDGVNHRLGIGNIAPAQSLDVTGNIRMSANRSKLFFQGDNATSLAGGLGLHATGSGANIYILPLNPTTGAYLGNGNIYLGSTGAYAVQTTNLFVNGQVGINTNSATQQLDVNGNIKLGDNTFYQGNTTAMIFKNCAVGAGGSTFYNRMVINTNIPYNPASTMTFLINITGAARTDEIFDISLNGNLYTSGNASVFGYTNNGHNMISNVKLAKNGTTLAFVIEFGSTVVSPSANITSCILKNYDASAMTEATVAPYGDGWTITFPGSDPGYSNEVDFDLTSGQNYILNQNSTDQIANFRVDGYGQISHSYANGLVEPGLRSFAENTLTSSPNFNGIGLVGGGSGGNASNGYGTGVIAWANQTSSDYAQGLIASLTNTNSPDFANDFDIDYDAAVYADGNIYGYGIYSKRALDNTVNTTGDATTAPYPYVSSTIFGFAETDDDANSREYVAGVYGLAEDLSGGDDIAIGVIGRADGSAQCNYGLVGFVGDHEITKEQENGPLMAYGNAGLVVYNRSNNAVSNYSWGGRIVIENDGTALNKYALDLDNPSDGGTKYGLHATVDGTGTANYGVYASASGATTNYAGYFDGDVVIGSNGTAVSNIIKTTVTKDISTDDGSNNSANVSGIFDRTFTVSNAATGSTVYISPNGLDANLLIVGAWISAANTVTVRFYAAVSLNPASRDFYITVIE